MDATARPVRLDDGAALDSFVAANDVALVELYTAGCPKCAAMEPVLGNVARVADVPVGMVNPADDPSLLDRFAVASVPTLVLFRDGEAVATVSEGFIGTEAVLEFVESNAPAEGESA